MPPALIIAAISAAVGAAGTGYSIYESGQQADAQKDALKAQQKLANDQNALRQKEAFAAAAPNAQAQTGGSLTGPAGTSFADVLAGLPSYYGGGAGQPGQQGAPGGQPQAQPADYPSILAALSQSQPQSQQPEFSGGFQPPNPPNQGRFNLSTFSI